MRAPGRPFPSSAADSERRIVAEPPKTLDAAVERLVRELTPEMRSVISEMSREELIGLHFGLGMAVRNGYGLHEPDSPLMADAVEQFGLGYVRDPDVIAGKIIERAWLTLRSTSES